MSAMVLNAFKDSNSSGTIIGYVSLYRSRALKSRTCNFESSLVHKNLSLCTVTYGEKVLSFHNKCAATVHRVLFCFDKIDNIIINSNCRYCYEHNRKLNNHLRMWRYASEIYWQINLISTDESQLRNWLNKESQFKTDCSINFPSILVHKLLDIGGKNKVKFLIPDREILQFEEISIIFGHSWG